MFSAFSLFPFYYRMFSNTVTWYCKAASTPSGLEAMQFPAAFFARSGALEAKT